MINRMVFNRVFRSLGSDITYDDVSRVSSYLNLINDSVLDDGHIVAIVNPDDIQILKFVTRWHLVYDKKFVGSPWDVYLLPGAEHTVVKTDGNFYNVDGCSVNSVMCQYYGKASITSIDND